MPEKQDPLTQAYCNGCKRETWHVRYVGWHRDDYGWWVETLRCRDCDKERDRYALQIENERLDKAHPTSDVLPAKKPEPDMNDMPLFAAMEEN